MTLGARCPCRRPETFATSLSSVLVSRVRSNRSISRARRYLTGLERVSCRMASRLPTTDLAITGSWTCNQEPTDWGPIYFCCHDAPVMLLQAATVQQFVSEIFKMYVPPRQSLIDDVHEDRLFEVWRKNPGVIGHSNAVVSPDPAIRAFAAGLDVGFGIVDLRNAPIGMGFSWGRYGPKTEVKRFGPEPIFAYRKPEKKGLMSRLFWR